MTKAENKPIYREDWYKEIEDMLKDYKKNKSRVRVLRIQLMKDVSPDAKLIATYGESIGKANEPEVDPKEKELIEKEIETNSIDAAIDGLVSEDAREIIKLRYFQGYSDKEIWMFKRRMSESSYYRLKNETFIILADILGKERKMTVKWEKVDSHKAAL